MERESMTVKDLIDFLEHRCCYDDIVFIYDENGTVINLYESEIYQDEDGILL